MNKTADSTAVPPAHSGDQLGFALFLALAAHALVIFGIGFGLAEHDNPAPTLEVTLAQHKSTLAPEQADYLAQFDQQGSGDRAELNKITTDRIAELPAPDSREATPLNPEPEQRAAAQPATLLSTQSDSERQTTRSEDRAADKGDRVSTVEPRVSTELSSLQARLDQQRQDYSKMPRINRLTAVSTRSSQEADYLRRWIEQVEQVGNANYPEEARRKQIYGDLRLAVTLLPDGSVDGIEILLSSGQRVLDQAAVRIVRQAAPFASLPAELGDWDKLEIIRTWRFVRGHQEGGEKLRMDN